jgi:hypothetical protein
MSLANTVDGFTGNWFVLASSRRLSHSVEAALIMFVNEGLRVQH